MDKFFCLGVVYALFLVKCIIFVLCLSNKNRDVLRFGRLVPLTPDRNIGRMFLVT